MQEKMTKKNILTQINTFKENIHKQLDLVCKTLTNSLEYGIS